MDTDIVNPEKYNCFNGVAVVDRNRCIGCGVCIPVCPTNAVALFLKPDVPRALTPMELGAELARARALQAPCHVHTSFERPLARLG